MKRNVISILKTYAPQITTLDEKSFEDQRDLIIAKMIDLAITWPTVDASTGYSTVPRNAFGRLTGLIFCHNNIHSYRELKTIIARMQDGLEKLRMSSIKTKDKENTFWLLRHAHTSLESIDKQMTARPLVFAETAQAARVKIKHAEEFHLKKLGELMTDEVPAREILNRLVTTRIEAVP